MVFVALSCDLLRGDGFILEGFSEITVFLFFFVCHPRNALAAVAAVDFCHSFGRWLRFLHFQRAPAPALAREREVGGPGSAVGGRGCGSGGTGETVTDSFLYK